MMATHAEDAAEEAGQNAPVRRLARGGGLVAYGLVHLLIGWTSLRVAWGSPDRNGADPSGAMKTLAQQPFGKALLWMIAVGMTALVLWQASEIIWQKRTSEKHSIRNYLTRGGRVVVYIALAGSAISVALGSGSSSSQSQQRATSGVLALPGGQVLVVVAGLVVIGVGVGMVVKGSKDIH